MTTHSYTLPFSPLESAPLSAGYTLRSSPYTLRSTIFDGLYDGTYKTLTLTTPPVSFTDIPPGFSTSRNLKLSEIIKEFETSKLFDDSRLEKLHKRLVKRYDYALLKKNDVFQVGVLGDECDDLRKKLKKYLNGEFVFLKLQICELDLARVALVTKLKLKYGDVIEKMKKYDDPYNTTKEKAALEETLLGSVEDFQDSLLKMRYLDMEKEGLSEVLLHQASKPRQGLRDWFAGY